MKKFAMMALVGALVFLAACTTESSSSSDASPISEDFIVGRWVSAYGQFSEAFDFQCNGTGRYLLIAEDYTEVIALGWNLEHGKLWIDWGDDIREYVVIEGDRFRVVDLVFIREETNHDTY